MKFEEALRYQGMFQEREWSTRSGSQDSKHRQSLRDLFLDAAKTSDLNEIMNKIL
jgi:hypothetical protein